MHRIRASLRGIPHMQARHFRLSKGKKSHVLFFAPSAVRPNSPVANEQKEIYHSPSSAKHKAKARADDRNPPSQDCSPHPAQKQHKAATNTNQNAKKGECNSQWQSLYRCKNGTIAHSDNPVGIDQPQNSQLTGKKKRSQSPS